MTDVAQPPSDADDKTALTPHAQIRHAVMLVNPLSGSVGPRAAGEAEALLGQYDLKAEVVSFADLDAAGSMADAKAAGKVRMEGKDYVMRDGDVVEFRFNV